MVGAILLLLGWSLMWNRMAIKAKLVSGGHVLDANNMDTTILVRLLMVIAKANGYQVLTRDIKNAYLYVDYDINIGTWVGAEFKSAGFKECKTRYMTKVEKALYGLPSSEQN